MGAVGGGSGTDAGFGGGVGALEPRLQPSFGGALSKLLSASAGVEDGEMLMLHQFLEEQVVMDFVAHTWLCLSVLCLLVLYRVKLGQLKYTGIRLLFLYSFED